MSCPQLSFQKNLSESKLVALQTPTVVSHWSRSNYRMVLNKAVIRVGHIICAKSVYTSWENPFQAFEKQASPNCIKDFRVVLGVVNFAMRCAVNIRQSNNTTSRWTHLCVRMQTCFIEPGHCAQYRVRPHQNLLIMALVCKIQTTRVRYYRTCRVVRNSYRPRLLQ